MDAKSLYRFPARMESLAEMRSVLKAVSFGTGGPVVLRAETALEELLTNSVTYGGPATAEEDWVWLSVRQGEDALWLHFEDAFAAFDPFPRIDEALQRTSNPMEQRPLGGLGLLMVFRLADEFRYARKDERNCMQLVFRDRQLSHRDP